MRRPRKARPQLAAGPIRRWVVGRPLLAAGDSSNAPGPESYSVKYRVGVAVRAAVVVVTTTAVVTMSCWALLNTTVLASPVVAGRMMVTQRAAWIQGHVPSGSVVTVLPSPVARDITSRLVMLAGGGDPASVAVVLGGPNQRASSTANGSILIDSKPTGYTTPVPIPAHDLGGAYLAVCLLGPCGTPGNPMEVPVSHVLGRAMGSLSFTGWEPVVTGAAGDRAP